MVYYNELDPFCAKWLRNLIAAGHIAPGDVDERDIRLVSGDDLRGYDQCHFFAGIGGWSYALRLAGWPDVRPVWTGSCPCQPFSAAGKREGFADERHLWPEWFRLIGELRPATIFGEQVSAAVGHGWLDAVFSDMETLDYACGSLVAGAHSVGAPHIRQRLWFVADAGLPDRRPHRAGWDAENGEQREGAQGAVRIAQRGAVGGVADAGIERRQQERGSSPCDEGAHGRQPNGDYIASGSCAVGVVGDPESERCGEARREHSGRSEERADSAVTGVVGNAEGRGLAMRGGAPGSGGRPAQSGETHWSSAHWLPFRDGKARPVEPGTFPLAHGIANRVGRLRAYGNAIVPQVAAEFIRAYLATHPNPMTSPTASGR